MGNVSKHFNRAEFACSDNCGFDAVDVQLLEWLEKIRDHFKKPLIIHCACRCYKKNKEVGSKKTSQHIKAKAVDFHIPDIDPVAIATYANDTLTPDNGGIGIYEWGIHLDNRQDRVRWDKRNG